MDADFLRRISIATGVVEKSKGFANMADLAMGRFDNKSPFISNASQMIWENKNIFRNFGKTDFPDLYKIGNELAVTHKLALKGKIGITDLYKIGNELSVSSKLALGEIGKLDWKEKFPEAFTISNQINELSKQFSRFSLDFKEFIEPKLELDNSSNFLDSLKVAINLETNQTEIFDPEIEAIFEITNEAFEKINSGIYDSSKILKKLYSKLSKFVNYPIVVGFIFFLANYYFPQTSSVIEVKQKSNTIEKLISESEIVIKHKPIKKYKVFERIPIGSEISVIERYRLWAKIAFINAKGVPQIGYCRIEELRKGAK